VRFLNADRIGQMVDLTVLRRGKIHTMSVTPVERKTLNRR
jgi:S1-C subfamily serine protease